MKDEGAREPDRLDEAIATCSEEEQRLYRRYGYLLATILGVGWGGIDVEFETTWDYVTARERKGIPWDREAADEQKRPDGALDLSRVLAVSGDRRGDRILRGPAVPMRGAVEMRAPDCVSHADFPRSAAAAYARGHVWWYERCLHQGRYAVYQLGDTLHGDRLIILEEEWGEDDTRHLERFRIFRAAIEGAAIEGAAIEGAAIDLVAVAWERMVERMETRLATESGCC